MVFHVSLLRNCVGDPNSIVPLESVGVQENLTYKEVPIEIQDCKLEGWRNENYISQGITEESRGWKCYRRSETRYD